MTTNAETLIDAVVTVLQTVNGAGGYTYDLSGSEGVLEGEPGEADGVGPSVWIWPEITTDDALLLTVDRVTLTLHLRGRVASTAGTVKSRARAAIRLFSDVQRALTASFSAGTLNNLSLIRSARLTGRTQRGHALAQLTSYGEFYADLVLTYAAPFGSGV